MRSAATSVGIGPFPVVAKMSGWVGLADEVVEELVDT